MTMSITFNFMYLRNTVCRMLQAVGICKPASRNRNLY